MAKKPVEVEATVGLTVFTRLLAGVMLEQYGDVSEITDLVARIDFKRPRASKYDVVFFPLARINVLKQGAETTNGYAQYQEGHGAYLIEEPVLLSTLTDAGHGLLSVNNEAGDTFLFKADHAEFRQYDIGGEAAEAAPAAAAAPAKGGKGGKAAAPEEAEEAPPPAAAGKGGKGGKGAKGGFAAA